MGTERTSDEVQQEMIDKMGTEFGSLFHSLHTELLWLTYRWIEFIELYGTKESRIELLNSSAPFLFYTVQKVLWENLLLGVARITDRAVTRIGKTEKKNVTIKAIPLFLIDDDFKTDVQSLIDEIDESTSFCRDWRNRRIAHMDHELHINKSSAKPLEVATRLKFKTTIGLMHDLYNKISFKYLGSQAAFEYLTSDRGAISLLKTIENGLRFEQERLEMKFSGNWKPDSFQSKV